MRQCQWEGTLTLVTSVNEINERLVGKEEKLNRERADAYRLFAVVLYCMYCIRTNDTEHIYLDPNS